jgi:hypothetical protein
MNTNAGSPEKIDADILQCRIDILRARDGGASVKKPAPAKAVETTHPKDRNPEPVKADESKSEKSSENSPAVTTEPIPEKVKIPKLEELFSKRKKKSPSVDSKRKLIIPTQPVAEAELCEVVEPVSESSEECAVIVETKAAEEKGEPEIKATPQGDGKLKAEIDKLKAEIKKMAPQDDDGEIMEAANKPVEQIPQLNLAEQILVEQRKVASLRRKKPDSTANSGKVSPVTGTMAEIINESKSKTRPAEQIPSGQSPCVHSLVTGSDKLGRGQQQIITNIVSADIASLCKMKASEVKTRQNFSNN